jgi:GTP-binding protein
VPAGQLRQAVTRSARLYNSAAASENRDFLNSLQNPFYSVINRYQQCRYLLSAHQLSQLPVHTGIEVAFAGRSNAGKSSAINLICEQKSLAKTSRTPGRTQAINYFTIDEQRYLIDLPGYGYARVPIKTRRHWQKTLTEYLEFRQSLQAIMLIMDIRHPLQGPDWYVIKLAVLKALPVHMLLTKCDKLSRNQSHNQLQLAIAELESNGIEATLQLFSAQDGTGVDDARFMLDSWFRFEPAQPDQPPNSALR